jgi:predicted nucleotidyltransferase
MNDADFGLKKGDLNVIIDAIRRSDTISKAVIFGSRAKGNYKSGSDIDIVIWSQNRHEVLQLSSLLNEEAPLPYKFDILDYNLIHNQELKEHINRRGIVIFEK